MSACAPEGFRLSLASSLAGFNEDVSLDALDLLVGRSLAEELDRDQRRYRLHALVHTAANGVEFAQKHAKLINEQFNNWETDWRICEQDLPDFQVAFSWALANRPSFHWPLVLNGYSLTRRIGRPAASFEICDRMIREEQTNKLELQACLGNQALILQSWGRLEEALALHKKEEAICLELGYKYNLQITYGNQAVILKDWGRLEEALLLHKKEEALCLEVGNKESLQRSYCNQADILRDCGRLEEALALLKRQEALCLELGAKAMLGYCYGNWGLLARAQNDPKTEQEKLTAALAIFSELQMPRERDRVAAELEKARGASAS
jgi:tetratricopeptide (TPR) repeat protein